MNTWSSAETHPLYTPTVYFVTPGVYEPHAGPFGTEWLLNQDGNPLVGVWIESAENAQRFADVLEVPVERNGA